MKIATLALTLAMLAAVPAWADEWVKCAIEEGYCQVKGSAIVKYGAGKQWATKVAIGSISCSPAGFGRDPALGVVKSCFYDSN